MNNIDTHLGRNADGTINKIYSTPDFHNASLLVKVPRQTNRDNYGIVHGSAAAKGIDIWNSYETSFLTNKCMPVNCILRIQYDSDNDYIVESKSLKLYLNSFNMECMGPDKKLSLANFIRIVRHDLNELLETDIDVRAFLVNDNIDSYVFPDLPYIENTIRDDVNFNIFNESPDLLKCSSFDILKIRTSMLRSNCRVTNQPDWGDVYIWMEGGKTPTIPSLASYIVSMRKENHFHEEICECIYKRLHDIFSPSKMVVACFYTRRGGIDINPIRYSSEQYFKECLGDITMKLFKTNRQ